MTFSLRVYGVVKRIPQGKTLSYKEVARLAGSPRACRAVGTILSKNFDSRIPCHRVIRSDGSLGEYNRGSIKKKKLLHYEGYKLRI